MQARTLRHGLAQLCALALMLPVSPAMADPIRITGGYFSVGAPFGVDLLFYTGGTGPDAYVGEGVGSLPAGLREFVLQQGPAVLRVTFGPDEVADPSSNSLCPGCGYGGDFTFQTLSEPLNGVAPFTMSGVFEAFAPGTNQRIFRSLVEGSGSVRVFPNPDAPFAGFMFESAAGPVPEPSSMVLLLSGGAAGWVRWRTRMRGAPRP